LLSFSSWYDAKWVVPFFARCLQITSILSESFNVTD
jgi:hypothetical protein